MSSLDRLVGVAFIAGLLALAGLLAVHIFLDLRGLRVFCLIPLDDLTPQERGF